MWLRWGGFLALFARRWTSAVVDGCLLTLTRSRQVVLAEHRMMMSPPPRRRPREAKTPPHMLTGWFPLSRSKTLVRCRLNWKKSPTSKPPTRAHGHSRSSKVPKPKRLPVHYNFSPTERTILDINAYARVQGRGSKLVYYTERRTARENPPQLVYCTERLAFLLRSQLTWPIAHHLNSHWRVWCLHWTWAQTNV